MGLLTATNKPMSKKVKVEPANVRSSRQLTNVQPPNTAIMMDLSYKTTTNLDWFKKDPWQDDWKSKILPTLCLWAGAQTNIWSTPKDRVASVLIIVIPVIFPDLDIFTCQLTSANKCIGVVRVLLM